MELSALPNRVVIAVTCRFALLRLARFELRTKANSHSRLAPSYHHQHPHFRKRHQRKFFHLQITREAAHSHQLSIPPINPHPHAVPTRQFPFFNSNCSTEGHSSTMRAKWRKKRVRRLKRKRRKVRARS